jgi:hypothetical protein
VEFHVLRPRAVLGSLSAVATAAALAVALPGGTASAAPVVTTCYSAAPAAGSTAPSFTDRTALLPPEVLRGRYGHAAGWGDANGDGLLDLFLGTYAAYPPLMQNPAWTDPQNDYQPDRLLINTGNGFRVDTTFPNLIGWTSGVVFTDLDRDGDDDLVVSRFAEAKFDRATAGSTVLLRNDGGTFVRTTALPAGPGGRLGGRSVGVLDYDADGYLDLYFVQDRYSGASSRLLRNPGSLGATWTDVTAAAGLPLDVEGFSATTTDLTGDGLADLFVAGSDRLFVRRAGGGFVEASRNVPAGPPPVDKGPGTLVNDFYTGSSSADLNGDGRLDLLLGAHYISVELADNAVPPVRLLLNRGPDAAGLPRFTDETAAAGLPLRIDSKSAPVHAQDMDNDGVLDILAGVSAGTSMGAAVPTVFRGTGTTTADGVPQFVRPASIAAVKGPTTPNASMAWVATPWADHDRDGRLDVFGDYFFSGTGVRLFSGASASRTWLSVGLDSRSFTGPGAVVEIYAAGGLGDAGRLLGRRTVLATDGYTSAVPVEARFGLGSAGPATVDVRVLPPAGSPTGTTDLPGVAVNRSVVVGGPCAEPVASGIAARYAAESALRTRLGAPVGTEQTDGVVAWQQYSNGRLYSSPATGVRFLTGPVLAKYLAFGGHRVLGAPTTDELTTPDGLGRYNDFGSASIYWTQATGAWVVQGTIRQHWANRGRERSPVGYPTADERSGPDGVTRYSTFATGIVTWTPTGGAKMVQGPIEDRWTALGGLGWPHGVPTTDELGTPDGRGRYNHFAGNASIYWSSATKAHAVTGAARSLWASTGWERGPLGYPTASERTTATGARYTTFQNYGAIYTGATTGTHSVYGSIGRRYTELGGPGSRLGLPTRDEYAVTGGRRTDFQGGSLTWNSRTGAVSVTYR